MNDYCQDMRDVIGYYSHMQHQNNVFKEIQDKKRIIKNRFIQIWLCKIINFHFKKLKKYKLIRRFLLPYSKLILSYNTLVKEWWYYAVTPNKRIINLKIPGKRIQECIDRIYSFNLKKDDKQFKDDGFRWTYKFIKDDMSRFYPNLKINFVSDQKLKTFNDHYIFLNEIILPMLEFYKIQLRKRN